MVTLDEMIGGNLTVNGTTDLIGNVTCTKLTIDNLMVTLDEMIGGNLTVNGTTDLIGNVTCTNINNTEALSTYSLLVQQDESVGGNLTIGGCSTLNGNCKINSRLFDYTLSAGTNGQVLSSTGTKVFWKNAGTYIYDKTGTLSDSRIYNGTSAINGTGGTAITLPANYSNSFFKVQLTHNAYNIDTANVGYLYANVTGINSFVIYSTNAFDVNYVNWMTTGSTVF
jgi:hypothetical protein